jgi:hypothetical protein
MKRIAAITGVAITMVALTIALVGCGSNAGNNKASDKAATTTTAAKTSAKVAPRISASGPNPTIASYVQQNGIADTPVHPGDPGAPNIQLPIPDGWADAGRDTPATAYWAIVDNGPEAAKYTPSIVATVSKLTGNVDQQKILDLAAGELKNLPGFQPMGDGATATLAGFPAYQLGGTWVQDGRTKAVAQKTVVIAASNALYVLRLNADCLEDQIGKALPATIAIDEQAKITI